MENDVSSQEAFQHLLHLPFLKNHPRSFYRSDYILHNVKKSLWNSLFGDVSTVVYVVIRIADKLLLEKREDITISQSVFCCMITGQRECLLAIV